VEAHRLGMRAARRWIVGVVLIGGVLALPARAFAATYTVNSYQDHAPDGCLPAKFEDCTLRDAITAANGNSGSDTITFAIPQEIGTTKPWVTVYGSEGPLTITDPVTINGASQPAWPGFPTTAFPPRVEVQAAGFVVASGGAGTVIQDLAITGVQGPGIDLQAGTTTVTGCTIGLLPSFVAPDAVYTPPSATTGAGVHIASAGNTITGSVISGNRGDGIDIESGDGNTITGNWVGPDTTGFGAWGNGKNGVHVEAGTGTVIGGTTTGTRNIISANGAPDVAGSGAGVLVDSAATGVQVRGNHIGVRFSGGGAATANRAMPNEGNGVTIAGTGNTVGGTSVGTGNLISGNPGAGVSLTGGTNQIQGNRIGTDELGKDAVPNGSGIVSTANDNAIGGTTAQTMNVVSGNAGNGITIGLTSAINANRVRGNRIGTDVTGVDQVPNGGDGIGVHSAANTVIGGSGTGEGNVISGNRARGVALDGTTAAPTTGTAIQGNKIGTDVAGTANLGNDGGGIQAGGGVTGATIGGTGTGQANTIAFNGGAGVRLPAGTGGNINPTGVAMRGNSIFSNTGLGIDLDATGVLSNDLFDSDDGPNHKQNSPDLSGATSGGGSTTVKGVLLSKPSTDYTIDYYSDSSCDSSGHGEGRTLLGTKTVTTLSGDGSQFVNATFPTEVPPGQGINATATDTDGNTSEFGACTTVQGPPAVSVSDVSVAESGTEALVVVSLDHASARPVTVDVNTADGTATAAADYTAQSQTFTFQPDQTQLGLHIPIQQDALDEADETFTVGLTNPSDATIADGSGAVTITDDDAAPSLSIADANVTEGTGGTSQMTFTVSLSAPSGRTVSVDAATADATAKAPGDYDATDRTLSFAPGATSRTVTVPVAPDSGDEPDETFTVGLSGEQFAGVTRRTATGTIADDDEPEKKPDPEIVTVPGPTVVTPGPTVVVPGQPEPRDTKAPGLTFGNLATTVKRKSFLATGLSFDVTPDEAASFEIALVGKTKSVTLARAGDTTLADTELPLAAGRRTVKLKLTSKLKRAFTKKKVSLELRISAFDAAGNRTRVAKALIVR
jgi:CSLREA domain-containing protein